MLFTDCLVDDPLVYDFHHVDPSEKEFAISKSIGSMSWKKTLEEAKKCVLLCVICHRKLHIGLIQLDETR